MRLAHQFQAQTVKGQHYTDGQGHIMSAKPGGHTACYNSASKQTWLQSCRVTKLKTWCVGHVFTLIAPYNRVGRWSRPRLQVVARNERTTTTYDLVWLRLPTRLGPIEYISR